MRLSNLSLQPSRRGVPPEGRCAYLTDSATGLRDRALALRIEQQVEQFVPLAALDLFARCSYAMAYSRASISIGDIACAGLEC